MDKVQAFNVLVQAVSVANKAGVFELKDSATILKAIETLGPFLEGKQGTEKSNYDEELELVEEVKEVSLVDKKSTK